MTTSITITDPKHVLSIISQVKAHFEQVATRQLYQWHLENVKPILDDKNASAECKEIALKSYKTAIVKKAGSLMYVEDIFLGILESLVGELKLAADLKGTYVLEDEYGMFDLMKKVTNCYNKYIGD